MMLALLLLIQPTTDEGTQSPAAWIAVLHGYEKHHGRTAWSWQELQGARSRVLDVHYTKASLPGRLNDLYSYFLAYAPIVLFLVTTLGLGLSLRAKRRGNTGRSFTFCVITLVLLLLGQRLTQGEHGPLVIIKQPGIVLRQGNGISYSPVLQGTPLDLAAGVEATYLTQQDNGWVQLRLSDGVQGWVPLEAVYLVE